jgi:hypothetical protein
MLFLVPLVLAVIGGATVWRGHELRGLIVISFALADESAAFALTGRWGWAAFCAAFLVVALVAMAFAKKAP